MVLYIIDHPYHYEAENLCRVFYPFDKVTVQHEFMPSDENRTVYTAEENGEYIVRIEDADGKTERKAKVGAETEYGMVSLLFDAFCAHTGKMPRWGMLTGIHPIKLLRQLTAQHGEAEAARLFRISSQTKKRHLRCAPCAHKSPLRIKCVKTTTLCTFPCRSAPRAARTAHSFRRAWKRPRNRSRNITACFWKS